MYQTGNVDILTLKQLLGHSNVGTTQIYTHLQEFQVRAAIEANPLGEVRAGKNAAQDAAAGQPELLDTTKPAQGEGGEELPLPETSARAQPMEAFTGAAQEGIRADVADLVQQAQEP